MIEFSGALYLVVPLVLGALLLRARRQLREALVACAVLDGAATIARKSGQEAANLREMLDALPMPVWRRGPEQPSNWPSPKAGNWPPAPGRENVAIS